MAPCDCFELSPPAFRTCRACCVLGNACASIEGCGAFTLTPSLYCEFRLGPANPGCCFLVRLWRRWCSIDVLLLRCPLAPPSCLV